MPKLMRMLVFGEEFAPPAYIPRMRYFCSYFLQKGWEIDYVVEGKGSILHIPAGVNVRAIDYYSRKGKSFERAYWKQIGIYGNHEEAGYSNGVQKWSYARHNKRKCDKGHVL